MAAEYGNITPKGQVTRPAPCNRFLPDCKNKFAHISKTLHNPKAANRITKNILDCCAHLKKHPLMGMSLDAKTGVDTDLRYLVCEQHLTMYRVEGDLVLIARILDGRTDYMRVLFKIAPGFLKIDPNIFYSILHKASQNL